LGQILVFISLTEYFQLLNNIKINGLSAAKLSCDRCATSPYLAF